jgi:hypothetical protein
MARVFFWELGDEDPFHKFLYFAMPVLDAAVEIRIDAVFGRGALAFNVPRFINGCQIGFHRLPSPSPLTPCVPVKPEIDQNAVNSDADFVGITRHASIGLIEPIAERSDLLVSRVTILDSFSLLGVCQASLEAHPVSNLAIDPGEIESVTAACAAS